MAYLTGRTRTLTVSGTLTGQNEIHLGTCDPSTGYAPELSEAQSVFNIAIWNMKIYANPLVWGQTTQQCIPPGFTGDSYKVWNDLHIEAHLASGTGDTPNADYSVHSDFSPNFCIHPDITLDWSGSWQASIDVEEVVSFSGGGNMLGFPLYGGAAAIDPPLENNMQLYEVAKIDGYLQVQVISQGQTLNTSIKITAANRFTVSYAPEIHLESRAYNMTTTASITAALDSTACGVAITYSNASGSASYAAGVSVTAISSGFSVSYADGNSVCQPPRTYNLSGVIRTFSQPYPSGVDMQIDRNSDPSTGLAQPMSGGATFSDSGSQRNYDVFSTLGTTSYSDTVDEYYPVRCWIRPGVTGDGYAHSLLALGEDPLDWRVMLRTFRWDALSMTQVAVQPVDSTPIAANWTAGANTTLGSGMTITRTSMMDSTNMSLSSPLTTQAPAGLQGSSFSGVSFAGYSFLRLYLTADADGQTARITLGSKTWDVKVDTTGFVDLDLCAPTNGTIGIDATDTKWPYASISPQVVTDGALWGVTNVLSFVISNLAVARVYTLTGIELRRKDHSKAYFLAPLTNGTVSMGSITSTSGWVLREPIPLPSGGVTTTTYVRRFLDHDTDGRRAREIEDFTWVHTDAGTGTDMFYTTPLNSLVGNTSYPHEGVTVVDLLPAPSSGCPDANGDLPFDCWVNSSLPLHYAFGGGAYIDSSGVWSYGLNEDISGTLTIPAQILVDSVAWYPGCGDVFGFNGSAVYGSTIELRAAKLIRADACGIVVNDRYARVPRRTVTLKDSTLLNRGLGKTVKITGEFETGTPFALGGTTDSAWVGTSNSSAFYPSRYRRRICFAVVPTCCQSLFCSDHFYFPFTPQAGDHTRLPLEDWRQIPDVAPEQEDEESLVPAGGGR